MLMYTQAYVYLLPEVGALMLAWHVCDKIVGGGVVLVEKPVAGTKRQINWSKNVTIPVLLFIFIFSTI